MAATYENAREDTEALTQKLVTTNLEHKIPTNLTGPNGSHDCENGDSDDEDAAALAENGAAANGEGAAAAKKKKKNKKSGAAKRKAAKATTVTPAGQQTEPPSIGLSKLFPNGVYPTGEILPYDETKFLDENRCRTPLAELKERERLEQAIEGNDYNLIRRAGEAHRQVRQYAQRAIKPSMTMIQIADLIENGIRTVIEADGPTSGTSGIGFPTGLSLNEVAAHYTPNAGDKRILKSSDVLKVDIGIHYMGRIVDSAFTMTFEPTWNPLLEAVKEATNTGIKEAGIDVCLGELGGLIQEVMESHEFEANGKTHRGESAVNTRPDRLIYAAFRFTVKSVRSLTGHSIERYSIHGTKQVPIVLSPDVTERMEENEYYAIETFGTTGRGILDDTGDCSHYSRIRDVPPTSLHLASAQKLLYTINKEFGTLPFCRRYLDRVGEKNYLLGLRHLVAQGIVQDYPPLADIPGSMTAQFEHTILLRPTCKEVVSRGDDY